MSEQHSETSNKFPRENKVGKPVTDKQREAITKLLSSDKVDMATASDIMDLLTSSAGVNAKSDPDKVAPISEYQAGELAKICPTRSVVAITEKVTATHGDGGYKWAYGLLGKTMVKDQSQEDKDKAKAAIAAEVEALFA